MSSLQYYIFKEASGHIDKSTCGFKKPLSKESQFFGSLDSVYSRSKSSSVSSAHDHGFINVTEHLDILRRAFSTEVMEKHQGEEGTKRHLVLLYFHYYQLFEIKHFQFQSIDNVKDEGQW